MPYAQTPWVRQGRVKTAEGMVVVLDTPAWFAWLDQVPSFCYSSSTCQIRLTVRREKRRGRSYWYAYSKIDAKLHNTYLGKTQRLTQLRLEQACQSLRQKASKKEGGKEAAN